MTRPLLVSVVLPVFNAERFLRRSVESILAQTYDTLELVIVDDGSTDSSAVIAAEFASRDARVRVVRLRKSGLPRALNAGVAASRGGLIARMDADDLAHPERLQQQVAYLEANPDCVLVGTAIDVMDANGASLGTRYFAADHEEIVDEMLHGTFAISHPAVVMRRDALLSVGGYDESLFPSDDFALWLALSNAGRLANLRAPLLRYRRHGDAVSVLNRPLHHALSIRIANAARTARGLAPLDYRAPASPASANACYHFDCARFALTGGTRRVALRHLFATIALAPLWVEPYAALLACALPRRLLFAALALRARLRAPLRERTARGDRTARSTEAEPAEP
jgi:glycosyltransferase involved in cell wall biosynthesis